MTDLLSEAGNVAAVAFKIDEAVDLLRRLPADELQHHVVMLEATLALEEGRATEEQITICWLADRYYSLLRQVLG